MIQLGETFITSRAKEQLDEMSVQNAMTKHKSGNWGLISENDKEINDEAVAEKDQILSVYKDVNNIEFYVITDAGHKRTTILLPEEY